MQGNVEDILSILICSTLAIQYSLGYIAGNQN